MVALKSPRHSEISTATHLIKNGNLYFSLYFQYDNLDLILQNCFEGGNVIVDNSNHDIKNITCWAVRKPVLAY